MEASAVQLSAVAAAAREAAHGKRKRPDGDGDAGSPPPAKKAEPDVLLQRPKCSHEVAIPKDYVNSKDGATHGDINGPRFTGKMAKEYPFMLDPFQETSIACLERNESVMVAAHTSAGKTVVAEYAIAMAFRDKQKVIYTSPLKALSNQKFRELAEEFEDVGIMTGDVCINESATCIVMTTEIMRSMMYKNSEIMREVQWVIFDEVHYMKDRERGVVWEESMIFLPSAARMVFLSATLSNSREFAEWVCHLHNKPCHVVYTDQRPTPLQHYAFPQGGSGLFLVCDAERKFREENFAQMYSSFEHQAGKGGAGSKKDGPGGPKGAEGKPSKSDKEAAKGDVFKLVKMVQDKKWDPVIVFAFNRRECEAYAGQLINPKLAGQINFNSEEEQEQVAGVFNAAIQGLCEDDRELPAVQMMLKLLKKGVGVHHSGLLPIIKELVEILFQEGLVKCLFATETFAMGLNMPARTVVFTALRKWDGEDHRWMASGEYIQMSGRAGRRGMDERGNVIMMVDDKMTEEVCKEMVSGKPLPLSSSFRLSFYTLLNLLTRMDGTRNMEHVIRNSFHQFQHERALPRIQAEAEALEEEAAGITVEGGEEAMEEYSRLRGAIDEAEQGILGHMLRPENILRWLVPGRLLRVRAGGTDWGWGILIQALRSDKPGDKSKGGASSTSNYVLDMMLHCAPLVAGETPHPAPLGAAGGLQVIPVPLPMVTAVSTLRTTLPDDLRKADARGSMLLALKQLHGRYPDGLPRVDPLEDMQLEDADLKRLLREVAELEPKLMANPCFKLDLEEQKKATLLRQKAELRAKAKAIRLKMSESQVKVFKDEAKHRGAVLKRLGYTDAEGVVTIKGRAACEVDTADELLAVELMLDGTFKDLDPHQTVALASCLLPAEKSNEEVQLKGHLAEPLHKLQETAKMIAECQVECKLELDVEEYVEGFKPTMMDVVYHWSKGEKFSVVCGMTDVFEGTIIRFVRRLDELLGELCSAAGVVGDKELAEKFAAGATAIRRDIIFAPSLYL